MLNGADYLMVQVHACAEAYLGLTDKPDIHDPEANVYEIVFGAEDNTQVAVR